MNQSLKRIIILSVIYGLLLLVPSFFGVLLSFTAQPGGISQSNAFVAPFLGPWSQTLRPNPHPVSTWSAEYSLFAKCLTAVLVLSVIGSYLATNDWLSYPAADIAVVTLVVWVLFRHGDGAALRMRQRGCFEYGRHSPTFGKGLFRIYV